jgi:hypothetical protein
LLAPHGGRPLRRRRENDVDLRPVTAARDRSSPGLQRSSLARPDGPLPADSLEGVPLRRRREMALIYGL